MKTHRLKYLLSEPLKYGASEVGLTSDETSKQVRYIRITDITSQGRLREDAPVYLPAHIAAPYMLEPNDILLARSGATVGKAFMFAGPENGACFAGYLIRARVAARIASPRFVYYSLLSDLYWSYIESYNSKSTIQNLNAELYGNVPVPAMPKSQQVLIADFLDRETAEADALVAKYERLIELLEEKRVALITQAVTKGLDPSVPMKESGVEWIGEIPLHWEIGPLGRAINDMCDGPFGSLLKSSHYRESGIQVIRLQNIGKGDFHNDNQAFIDTAYFESLNGHDALPGDLLVAGLGDTNNFLGRACLLPREIGAAMVKADCFRLRLDTAVLLHEFTMHYLNSGPARAEIALASKGATRDRLNLGSVARLRLPYPPVSEQRMIVAAINDGLNRIDLICQKLRSAVALVRDHRTALITAAVTGQIDVNTYRFRKQQMETLV